MPGIDDFRLSSADNPAERARWTAALTAMHAGAKPAVADPGPARPARPRHRDRPAGGP